MGVGRPPGFERGGAVIAVSLVLTLVGAALFVVSLFRSDDLNIVLLCIGCALLAAVFLGVGALRSRPSRKPVLASGAQDQAPDALPPARQPAGATSLSVLERDEQPPGWASPVATGGSRQETPQPADDTSWRRPKTTPAPSRPVAAEELPAEEFVEDELPEDEPVDDELSEEEFIEEPPMVKPARTAPAKPRVTPVKSARTKSGAAKAGPAKIATAKVTAARVTAVKAAKATSPARAVKSASGAAPAAKTTKAASPAPAASPSRTSRAKATPPAKTAKATPSARKSAPSPVKKKAQAEAVDIGLSARDAARVEEALGPVSGLGPAKRAQLLQFFGTWRRLRNASVERLAQVPGITPPLAERIRAALDE